jgi:GNAT superfamily N-acetyltransferase
MVSPFKKRRCQAKNPAACIDPQCPEKRSGQHILAQAIRRGDLDAYIAEREKQEQTLRVGSLQKGFIQGRDWDKLHVLDEDGNFVAAISTEPELIEGYREDTSVIKRFDSYKDIESHYRTMKDIMVFLQDNHGPYNEESLPGFSLREFYVSPALRGQGVGQHIMKTLTTHADEKNMVIELVPTEAGDGRLEEGHPQWKEQAIAHKARLTAFYESHGFELNPFYYYSDRVDYLTGEAREPDMEARSKFTRKAEKILKDHSMYIRYPNGKYPKGWVSKK